MSATTSATLLPSTAASATAIRPVAIGAGSSSGIYASSSSSFSDDSSEHQLVLPGDFLGNATDFESGNGTFIRQGKIHASLAGIVQRIAVVSSTTMIPTSATTSDGNAKMAKESSLPVTKLQLQVISHGTTTSTSGTAVVPEVGDEVVARVIRITAQLASCEILICGGVTLPSSFSAVLRKEHVREGEIDKVRMDECVRPGDLVVATVASLGDARSYFLSTTNIRHGVVYAKSEAGNVMNAITSWAEMEDSITGAREKRKVANVETKIQYH